MPKSLTFISSLLIVLFLYGNMNGQDQNRWNTKIFPDYSNSVQNPVPINHDFKFNADPMVKIFGNKTYTIYPNILMHPTNGTGSQSEMSIAVNPFNPNILIAGSNAANTAVTYLNQGWYVTTNGGQTWYGNDSLPLNPAGYYRSDPVTGFDQLGNMFFNTLEYSSSAGDVVTLKSTNNGITWTKTNIPNAGADEDKNWMAIDQNPGSPYANYVYTAYTEFNSSDPNYYKLEFSRSTDHGATFSTPMNLAGTGGYLLQGVNLAVNKNNNLVACYTHYPSSTLTSSNVGFVKSTDGGVTFSAPVFVASGVNDIRGNLTKGGQTVRVNSFPQIATDNSNGPHSGRIYVTWAGRPVSGQAPDVYLSWSDDNGATWSPKKRVNADSSLTTRDQYFPSVDVDPADGSVNLIYYDSRNFTANDSVEVYLSRSVDGGLTFEDIKVSDHAFLPRSIPGLATGYQGDYIEVVAKNGIVWPCWADCRTGQYQGYTAKVFFIQIDHAQLPNTENLAGPYTVRAKITASQSIADAKVFWRRGTSGAFDSLAMSQIASTDTFVANIPGNGSPSVYQYYIYAKDAVGSYATLPGGAPSSVFSFEAAGDAVPPVITHTVIPNQYRETWPATVNASVTDNIGVDSVWVEYKLNNTGSTRRFNLSYVSGSNWSGVFNIDTTLIALGDSIMYRIVARDASVSHNLGYNPSSTGYNTFRFIPDTDFPVITHSALRDQPIIRWPAVVAANVTDQLGVLSVSVETNVNNGSPVIFNLVHGSGNTWSAAFPMDTTLVHVGDSVFYKIKAVDNSTSHNVTYSPVSGYYKFKVIATKGMVLVVNDDVTLLERVSADKTEPADMKSPLGASSTLIAQVLQQSGYVADTTTFTTWDASNINNYDIVVLSAGTKTAIQFSDQAKRTAVVNYNRAGGKVFVEGGEVGWNYRVTSEIDATFRREILRDSSWVSDYSSGLLKKRIPYHAIWNTPNYVQDSLGFSGTGYGYRDVVTVLPNTRGIYKLGSWWGSYPDTAGIIAYSPTNDTNYVTNIFCTFAIGGITNQTMAAKLVENLFEYLTFGWSAVPVELTAFNASVANNTVNLIWQTATEVNNSGFQVERRTSSSPYMNVGFVPGKGTTTNPSSYSFTDDNLNSGTYYYRLKQIDFDGKTNYSEEVSVEISAPAVFELSQNYPNPFNPSTSIKFSVPKDGMVTLAVYNLLGEKIATLVNQEMKAGRHEVRFEASKLSSGLYLYRLDAGTFSSVKKMMLLK